MVEGSSITSFAYGQGKVVFVDDHTLATSTGNGVVFFSIKTNQQKHIWGGGSRLGASEGRYVLASAPGGQLVAYAPAAAPGHVTLITTPKLNIVKTLECGAELGYADLVLSRCQSRLAVIKGLPDYQLSIWDWEAETVEVEHQLGEAFTGYGASFFPGTASVFVSFGRRKAIIMHVESTTSPPTTRTAEISFPDLVEEEHVTVHTWTEGQDLYIGTSHGRVLRAADAAPDPSPAPKWGEGRGPPIVVKPVQLPTTAALGKSLRVAGLLATKLHLIVAYAQPDGNGVVVWHSRTPNSSEDSPSLPVAHVAQVEDPTLCWLSTDGMHRKLVLGSTSGAIYTINPTIEEIPGETTRLEIKTDVSRVVDNFSDAITGVTVLSGDRTAAIGEDGTLRIQEHKAMQGDLLNSLKAVWFLGEPGTACAADPEEPLVALGTQAGVVQIVDVDKAAMIESESSGRELDAEASGGTQESAAVVFSCRMHSAPVIALSVSERARRVASLAQDGTVAVLELLHRPSVTKTWKFQVSCVTSVPGATGALVWAPEHPRRPDKERIVLAVGPGDMLLLTPPKREEAVKMSSNLVLPHAKLLPQTVRTQSPLVSLAVTKADGAIGDIWVYAATADRAMRRFRITAASAEQRRTTNSYLLAEVDKPQECLAEPKSIAMSPDSKLLLVSTVDGCINAFSLPVMAPEGRWALHDPTMGGATRAAVFHHKLLSSHIAVSGGGDAAFHVMELGAQAPSGKPVTQTFGPGGAAPIPSGFWDPGNSKQGYPELYSNASDAVPFAQALQEEQKAEAQAAASEAHNQMREKIKKMREKFQSCITQNENAPEDERLPRQEFVMDRQLRNILLAKGDDKIQKLKHELQMQSAREMLQYERVKAGTWDSVDQMHTQLFAIGVEGTFEPGTDGMPVPPPPPRVQRFGNYPIRKVTRQETRRTHVVKFLRQVEIHEWEKRAAKDRGHVAVIGYQESQEAEKETGGDIVQEDSQLSSKSRTSTVVDDDQLVGEKHQEVGWGPGNLLYKELAMHGSLRKRTQLMLLDQHLRAQKVDFNKKFDTLLHQKLDAIAKVDEHNKRTMEILEELETANQRPFSLKTVAPEDPESQLKVRDEEMASEKYIPPEERARLEAEAAAHAAALEAAGKDSAATRALQMMMHGTLERKEDKKAALLREPWMDMPQKEMTKEQRAALKEFEKKVAELEEEMENHRRALEGEMRGLENDTEKTILHFNESMQALFQEQSLLDMHIYTSELQAIRQAATLEEAEYNQSQAVEVGEEAERLRKLASQRAGVMTELQKLVFRQRVAVDHLASEDKSIEKSWKKEFLIPELEEHHDMFAKMFKDRRRGMHTGDASAVKRGHTLSKSSRNLNSSLKNPTVKTPSFKSLTTPKTPAVKADSKDGVHHEEVSAVPDNLDPFDGNLHWEKEKDGISLTFLDKARFDESDWPENVSEAFFARLMELRDAKIIVEEELKIATAKLGKLTALVDAAQDEETLTNEKVNGLMDEMGVLSEELEKMGSNLDMTYQIKMGQLDVPEQAVIPDLSDAALMHRSQIEILNSEVVARATGNISQMKEICSTKQHLGGTTWENASLDLLAEHKTQHISELQLLHVSREIQEFMADPERALSYNQEAQLQGQLSVNEKTHKLKITLMKKRLAEREETATDQQLENQYLRENTAKAAMALEERERMNSALDGAEESPAKQRARAFRNIVTNQKLLDISRSQMEELHFLRAEVERLRARSYPSFATAPRPLTSPDLRMTEEPKWWPAPGGHPPAFRPATRGATAPAPSPPLRSTTSDRVPSPKSQSRVTTPATGRRMKSTSMTAGGN